MGSRLARTFSSSGGREGGGASSGGGGPLHEAIDKLDLDGALRHVKMRADLAAKNGVRASRISQAVHCVSFFSFC